MDTGAKCREFVSNENQTAKPITFTRKRYVTYPEHLSSAIVAFYNLKGSEPSSAKTYPIHALELKLHQNELHLLVECQQHGETSIYILHTCQEGAVPLKYLRMLFANIGNKVLLSSVDQGHGSQSAAKVLTALKIVPPLRKLFFAKSETHSTILYQARAVLSDHVGIDPLKITHYVCNLGLPQIEGPFSRINYQQYQKANPLERK
jgi:hypothetical protein